MKEINDVLSWRLISLKGASIEIGMMCAAPFPLLSSRSVTTANNHSNTPLKRYGYYRARVTHRIDNVTVEVFFVDCGNTEQVPIDQCNSRTEEKQQKKNFSLSKFV